MHRSQKKLFIILAVLIILLVPARTVAANAGPKPSMEFEFEYEITQSLEIEEAFLFDCESSECREPVEQEYSTPPFFTCTFDECSSFSYGYGEYLMLEITFSDGITRKSNVFGKEHFAAEYTITIFETSLHVEETGGSHGGWGIIITIIVAFYILGSTFILWPLIGLVVLTLRGGRPEPLEESSRNWVIALWDFGLIIAFSTLILSLLDFSDKIPITFPLTLIIEGAILFVICKFRRQPSRVPLALNLTANLYTQALLLFLLSNIGGNGLGWFGLLGAELGIVLIEAVIFFLPQRRQITFRYALGLSFVLNLASFTIGLFLPV